MATEPRIDGPSEFLPEAAPSEGGGASADLLVEEDLALPRLSWSTAGGGSPSPDQQSSNGRHQLLHLQQPARFLRSIVDATGDAVIIVDGDLRITWTSGSATAYTGWSEDEAIGEFVGDFLHPEDVEEGIRLATKLLNDDEPGDPSLVARLRFAGGHYRWVQISGDDLRTDPSVEGIILVISDHQSTMEAQAELNAVSRRHAALLRHSSDCLFVASGDMTITYVSPALEGMLGWRPVELIGSRSAQFLLERDRGAMANAHRLAILDPSTTQVLEVRAAHKNGDLRWLEVTMTAQLDDHDVRGVISNLRDVTERNQLVRELEDSNESLRNLAFSSSTGLFEEDFRRGITSVNTRFEVITGLSADQILGRNWRSVMGSTLPFLSVAPTDPDDQEKIRFQFERPDGRIIWLDARSTVLPPNSDGARRRIGGIEDVNDVVEAETSTRRFAEVFNNTDDLVLLFDPNGVITYANRAAAATLGHDVLDLNDVPELADVREGVELDLIEGGGSHWRGETTLRGLSGKDMPVSLKVMAHRDFRGEISFFSVVARDISERIALEGSLALQARHDPLTGLPNRVLLLERLEHVCELARLEGSGERIALLFVDIDHFKVINDSLGHSLGDELLREIGARIQGTMGPADMVARFGGDEFVVLCGHTHAGPDPLDIARNIEKELEVPFHVRDQEIHIGVSTGIAFADPDRDDPGAVLRDADTAMYEAKTAGRGQWVVFDENLRRLAVDRQETETALRRSRNGENLELRYQPVFDLATRRLLGFEALLRWWHLGELIPPERFVPVAEDTGLIVPIGNWVMGEATRQAALWQELSGREGLGIAVNVSARQLQRPDFLATVAEHVVHADLDPGTLTVEITESVVLEDTAHTASVLTALKDMNVGVAVDDFGTGYSSLTYLHKLPFDIVKLDRSFVAGVTDSEQKRAIVTAVLGLTNALGLQSIAEGIETERQLTELMRLGCNSGQGHLVAGALTAEVISDMLQGDCWDDPEGGRRV